MYYQHGRRAAITKHDTTTALRNPTITKKRKVSQSTRYRQVATSNTKVQLPRVDNCNSVHVLNARTVDIATENKATAADFTKEIALVSHQLIEEGVRALVGAYETLIATAHFLAHACKLMRAVGCLTMVVGKDLFAKGKSLWRKFVA